MLCAAFSSPSSTAKACSAVVPVTITPWFCIRITGFSAFAATCFFGVNVVYVVSICALFGVVRTLAQKKKERAEG